MGFFDAKNPNNVGGSFSMTTRSYPEKFHVLDRLDQPFEMMSQICQIHVEFHVAFVRFEAKRNVVQDMTCMVSFDSIFHQECIYCGLWDQKQCFKNTNPSIWVGISVVSRLWKTRQTHHISMKFTKMFIPETLFLICMMEIWSRNVSHAIRNEILHRMICLVWCWLQIENPRGLSRDIWQDPRGYIESMNHGCHVCKISQDMTE